VDNRPRGCPDTRKAIRQSFEFRSGDAALAVLREIRQLDRELSAAPHARVSVDAS
jgi:hypothetical protein